MNEINIDKLNRETELLSTLMLPERFDTIRRVVEQRTNYVTVCLENIYHSQNASAVIRSCEAFGVQNIHVIENRCHFHANVDIVKGSDKWLDIHRHNEDRATENLIKTLRADGYRIVATSPHINGVSAENYDVGRGKIALFFGTEKQGISETVKQQADDFIQIEMFGFVESLNISVCAAIVLNAISQNIRRKPEIDWKLTKVEQIVMLNRWMRLSVKDSERIIKNYYK